MVPTRGPAGPAYDWTEYDTAATPVPLAPAVTDNHDESLVAVHAHAGSEGMTTKDAVPPADVKLPPGGLRSKVQAPAFCVTV